VSPHVDSKPASTAMTDDDRDRSPSPAARGGPDGSGLRLRSLHVTHPDGTVALEDVTFDVAPGEVLAIVGPSGSGKTTLLRAVAGLVEAAGRVDIGGRDMSGVRTQERNLAMVFEAGGLIPNLNVAENVGFSLRLHKVPRGERQDRVAWQARRLRLGQFLNRRPADLSAGERGRADVARATVRRPSAWLLDEPLAHLDPVERFDVRHQLVQEAKRHGVPTLYVTHDPVEALAVGDRVAVLRDGRVVQVDSPRDLYARPVNVFVATFVSAQPVGLLPARVVRSGEFGGLQVGDRILPLWAGLPAALEFSVNRTVVLALRAEDVRDAAEVDDPDVARLPGLVVATEFTGPHVIAAVELDSPPPAGRGIEPLMTSTDGARVFARLPREHRVQLASRLTLAVDPARAHVFDPSTGDALWHPNDPRDDA
jgi:multiple sugar transport system ATP-binding protein